VKYLDEFRDPELAQKLLDEIRQITTRHWTMMEVCGGADPFHHPQRHRPAAAG
jgi:hydrogenase maturation factor